MMIKRIATFAAAMALASAALLTAPAVAQDAPASSLSELLQRIRQDNRDQSAEARAREQEFQAKRNEQAAILQRAKDELAALEAEGVALAAQFDANDVRINELNEELLAKQGAFGELFGVARQAASDLRATLNASNISAQLDDRTGALTRVAESSRLPTRRDLDEIWKGHLEEMVAQREVVTFTTRVANFSNDGTSADAEVTRIGAFTLFARDGGKARFVEFEDGTVKVLNRQPADRIVAAATKVMRADPGELVAGPLDPSRGELLGLVVDTPTLRERIDQGGTVGYVIILLAVIGVAFGVLRLVSLTGKANAVRGQARRLDRPGNNELGRILKVADEAKGDDIETLELKLDDAIIRESNGLDFGMNFLKLAAAIAPLLGLLGTVTGMIITFQQITLFGTGDPKIMAGGISQALITTVLGLVAAIPLLLIHSFCSSASRGVQQVLEEQAAGIVAKRAGGGSV